MKYTEDFEYNFDSEYDFETYNEYEGYSNSYKDDFEDYYEGNINDIKQRCECCNELFVKGYSDSGYLCKDCLDSSLQDDEMITIVDATELNKDDFYLENGIMDKHVEIPVYFDKVINFKNKRK